jgi:hypothetical protein
MREGRGCAPPRTPHAHTHAHSTHTHTHRSPSSWRLFTSIQMAKLRAVYDLIDANRDGRLMSGRRTRLRPRVCSCTRLPARRSRGRIHKRNGSTAMAPEHLTCECAQTQSHRTLGRTLLVGATLNLKPTSKHVVCLFVRVSCTLADPRTLGWHSHPECRCRACWPSQRTRQHSESTATRRIRHRQHRCSSSGSGSGSIAKAARA